MNAYIPLVVIAGFGIVLFFGTILWTEKLFPEKDKRQAKFNYDSDSPSKSIKSEERDLAHAR